MRPLELGAGSLSHLAVPPSPARLRRSAAPGLHGSGASRLHRSAPPPLRASGVRAPGSVPSGGRAFALRAPASSVGPSALPPRPPHRLRSAPPPLRAPHGRALRPTGTFPLQTNRLQTNRPAPPAQMGRFPRTWRHVAANRPLRPPHVSPDGTFPLQTNRLQTNRPAQPLPMSTVLLTPSLIPLPRSTVLLTSSPAPHLMSTVLVAVTLGHPMSDLPPPPKSPK